MLEIFRAPQIKEKIRYAFGRDAVTERSKQILLQINSIVPGLTNGKVSNAQYFAGAAINGVRVRQGEGHINEYRLSLIRRVRVKRDENRFSARITPEDLGTLEEIRTDVGLRVEQQHVALQAAKLAGCLLRSSLIRNRTADWETLKAGYQGEADEGRFKVRQPAMEDPSIRSTHDIPDNPVIEIAKVQPGHEKQGVIYRIKRATSGSLHGLEMQIEKMIPRGRSANVWRGIATKDLSFLRGVCEVLDQQIINSRGKLLVTDEILAQWGQDRCERQRNTG